MALLSNNTTIGGKNPLLYTTISNTSVNLNTYYDEGSYKFNNLTSATNFPSSFSWTGSGISSYLQVIKFNNSKPNNVIQIIYRENSYINFIRYCNFSSWSGWQKLWNAGNDGGGSGLDADLLDYVQGSGYIRDYGKTYSNFNSLNRSGFYQLNSASNSPDGSGGLWGCIVFQTDSGNNTSTWLCQIAIKDNVGGKQLYTRKYNGGNGWTSWEKIWTSNTDGTGSGLDADTLDGKHASEFLITDSNTYCINSQSDFNTMINSSTWGGKSNVVFNCSVVANYKDVVIPTSVRYINGNGNSIDQVKSFGYANEGYNKNRRIENLTTMNLYETGSLSPNVEDYRIEFTGFKNCSNLYNCRATLQPVEHKSDLSNIRRGFSKCYNLHNCVASHKGNYYESINHNIMFDSCNYIYNCYSGMDSYGDGAYYNCQYIYESIANTPSRRTLNGGIFYNCKDLYNCSISGYVNDVNGNVFVNCTNLNGCYYNHDILYYSIFINCTNLINCSVTTNSTNQKLHYINCTNLIDCVGTKDATSTSTSTSMDNIVYVSRDLLTAIKDVDGSGSGIDADLLDGKQAYTFAKYGIASASLSANSLTQTSTGTSSLYRFQDTNNIIGEGTNVYYGIIQIYYSASYYTRLAISMASGKVYRQTNGATSWNEISVNANPTIPVVTTDPTTIENGQLWIRSDL